MSYAAIALISLLALLAGCSSEQGPGEPCDIPGGTVDVCEPGTVCGRPSNKSRALVCVFACLDNRDCPRGYECKGVEGTGIKGCRYDD